MTRTWSVPRPVPRGWHFDCGPRPVVREPDLGPFFSLRPMFSRCPLLAQSGHPYLQRTCPLSGVKRTCRFALHMSAFDPKRTLAPFQRDSLSRYDGRSLSVGATIETARVHHPSRWHGGSVAVDDARAAASNAGDWVHPRRVGRRQCA